MNLAIELETKNRLETALEFYIRGLHETQMALATRLSHQESMQAKELVEKAKRHLPQLEVRIAEVSEKLKNSSSVPSYANAAKKVPVKQLSMPVKSANNSKNISGKRVSYLTYIRLILFSHELESRRFHLQPHLLLLLQPLFHRIQNQGLKCRRL